MSLLNRYCVALIATMVMMSSMSSQARTPEDSAATTEISQFVTTLDTIRMYMAQAPGRGHQIAGLRIIQRLREFGFRGVVQIIYEEDNRDKLAQLLPGFDKRKTSIQNLRSEKYGQLELVERSSAWVLLHQKKVSLGISGAEDVLSNELKVRGELNVETFVQLQPRLWTPAKGSTRSIYLSNGKKLSLKHLSSLGTITRTEEAEDWDELLGRELSGNAKTRAKIPFLSYLIQNLDQIDMMPGYSLDYMEPYPEEIVGKIVHGLLEASRERPDLFFKPIVVPVFSEFPWKPYFKAVKDRLKALGVPYLDAAEPDVLERVSMVEPGKIVFVQVGPVSAPIFDPIFELGTLPALLEGKNLTNSMIDHGRSFLNVTGSLDDIKTELNRPETSKDVRQIIIDAFSHLANASDPSGKQGYYANALTNFFIAMKEDTKAREFFIALKNDPESVKRDLLGQALLELIKSTVASSRQASPIRCMELLTTD